MGAPPTGGGEEDGGGGVRLSQRRFQETLARLVLDPPFREIVRAQGAAILDDDLTPLERERLTAAASDRGLDAMRTLHKSFRLTKLYSMLPLTRALLGQRRLVTEVNSFWAESLPVSHYFLDESLAFCDYLRGRMRRRGGLRVKYLDEVLAYERAVLELRRVRPDASAPAPQLVRFRHAPEILLTGLAHRRRPRAVPIAPCTLVGSLDRNGNVRWRVREEKAAGKK